ncbi:MAG: UbiA family prenyltransferase [Pseudomonas sp.]|uniref:UbiA family prenyltransferase n=1 Tax=Pseudomonas sp. TaxID=306 RepID=UPI0033939DFD
MTLTPSCAADASLRLLPLVVDLDGTLLRSDILLESALVFVKAQPLRLLAPLAWLAKGKAHLKERLAHSVDLNVASLPYDPAVIALIETERGKGRKVVLATASHRRYAEQIAEHLQLFDQVLASDGQTNLTDKAKRDCLVAAFGERGFDYVGNSMDDLSVWSAARHAYVANPERGVLGRAQVQGNVEQVLDQHRAGLKDWLKALRVHQWMKNLLIFVPLLAGHQLNNPALLLKAVIAFVLFGLCASSVYLLNDLLDLEDDRHHPTKRKRPFAAGVLALKAGVLLCPLLLVLAFAGAACWLPWPFMAALGLYYVITLAYSIWLKRLMVVDVITLAALYTMRIIAGAMAVALVPTFWLLAFSMFVFLSLALVKRYAELRVARSKGHTDKARGRGYYPDDLEMIASMGAASGYLSVMVLALYIQDGATAAMYRHPEIIWSACPLLLFWISRMWMLTHRGAMHDDPIVFAIKDRVSLVTCGLIALVFWLAT